MSDRRMDVIGHGLVAGVIGYGIVAALGIGVSILSGKPPFHTAAVLGATLLGDAVDPATFAVTPGYVFAYNGVHLLAFLTFGLLGSWLATLADRGAQLWYVALFLFMFVGFHMIAVAQSFSEPVRAAVSESAIWMGGIVASLAMAAYLILMHPALRVAQRWDG
ncbi:MAG TPA: hypothetical protein VMM18_08600 [Gemmatimonadaceae bacterium]|nr:hypothetical protein [Gemmatimonadaceae bacterium]